MLLIYMNIFFLIIFQEKNKYEISVGTLKSSDELIELYIELITKNPRIKMIIEPFNSTVIFFKYQK